MALTYSEVKYKNFGRCLKIENELAEVFVTLDLGPRVIRYALRGGHNFFFEDRARTVKHDEKAMSDFYGRGASWFIYGGHRIWVSPESLPRCYYPDNKPIEYTVDGTEFTFTPAPQVENGLQMQLVVSMEETSTRVTVKNRVTNIAPETQEFSVWALSVLAPGGVEFVPMNTNDTGLLGNRTMALWPYTNMADKRVAWGKEYIMLRQSRRAKCAFKVGMDNRRGFAAYVLHGAMFVKRLPYAEGAAYPDGGMNFETYTNDKFLEMESLSPLTKVANGEMREHVEKWEIIPDIRAPRQGDFDAVNTLTVKNIE